MTQLLERELQIRQNLNAVGFGDREAPALFSIIKFWLDLNVNRRKWPQLSVFSPWPEVSCRKEHTIRKCGMSKESKHTIGRLIAIDRHPPLHPLELPRNLLPTRLVGEIRVEKGTIGLSVGLGIRHCNHPLAETYSDYVMNDG
ncbi:hypothetical protein [Lamprobacter modestohalophilus]|uniref:hypothetical protein n=1 Tax=Lamprobacter modestohalophilus TaxID=1064514 RepID=UPI0019053D47|nr:hypothetical protein [Lamprobacter modestohalophilus]